MDKNHLLAFLRSSSDRPSVRVSPAAQPGEVGAGEVGPLPWTPAPSARPARSGPGLQDEVPAPGRENVPDGRMSAFIHRNILPATGFLWWNAKSSAGGGNF